MFNHNAYVFQTNCRQLSASSLQLLLGVCEKELEYLDMTINVKNHRACVSAQDIILNVVALQLVMVEKYCEEIR